MYHVVVKSNWDYVVDDAQHGAGFRARSPVFGDDWFGAVADSNASSRAIPRGRWAFARLPDAAAGDVANVYGLARAPWNADASPSRCAASV